MPDSGPAKADKPSVSPVRNAVGLAVLIAVLAIGAFQYSAMSGFNKAVTALEARAQDESKELLSATEAATLLGKEPDGPGEEVTVNNQTFSKRTYTWSGLLKSYKLTAFFTKQADPRLHHFETEGAPPAPAATATEAAPASTATTAPGDPIKKGQPAAAEAESPPAPSPSAATTAPDEAAKKKDPEK